MRSLRVATFNIQHGRGGDGRVDLARLGHACAALNADVLGLQEVDVGLARSHGADLVAVIAEATGLYGVFGPAVSVDGGQYGNALLARELPIDVECIPLPGRGGREPRAGLLARVGEVSFAVTHLSVGADQHAGQLAAAAAALTGRPGPHVLLGDLNHDRPHLASFALAVAGPTWPVRRPQRRIDHVAVAGLDVESAETVALPVSDHRALVVTLRLVTTLVRHRG